MVNLKRSEIPQMDTMMHQMSPLPREALKRLNFTLSHLLLPPNSRIAVMASQSGRLVYEYAGMRPSFEFFGIDRSAENVQRARKFYDRENLQFMQGSVDDLAEEEITVDAFLNIGSLHQLYSRTGYNQARVLEEIKKQIDFLPTGGQIIIQDYFTPPTSEIVFFEVPKRADNDDGFGGQSPADLLLNFSQNARPLDTSGGQGFLLEEEEPHRVGTRLFRLPFKWAVEFLYRVSDPDNWEKNLEQEYTIFPLDVWQKELNALGARVNYSTPYYRYDLNFSQNYAFYNEQGEFVEIPPRGFICVVEKIQPTDPLFIQERRSSLSEKIKMSIETNIDDETAEAVDLVKRHQLTDDLLPWRIDEEGDILVTVRTGVPRPVINASSRGVPNLDGKKWAGYLIEPIVMPVDVEMEDQKNTAYAVLEELLNIDRQSIRQIQREAQYYPKPEFLVQRLRGFSARLGDVGVLNFKNQNETLSVYRELNKGHLVEFYAHDILQAINVGLIPDSRLEILMMQLMSRVGTLPQGSDFLGTDWETMLDEAIDVGDILNQKEFEDLEQNPESYMTAEQVNSAVKHVRSVFVKQGNIGGLPTSIDVLEEEFILPMETTTNTVVCFPLSIDSATGLKVVGVEPKKMPIPSRMDGQVGMVQLPSFQLSNDIKTFHQLREFLAEKFDCDLDGVTPMGSSFFACPEISPERVYPFAIFNPGKGSKILLKNAPMDVIKVMMRNIKPHSKSSGVALFKGMRDLGEWYQGGLDHDLKVGAHDMLEPKAPEQQVTQHKKEQRYEPK